jgi:hypothetical protein
MGRLPKRLNPAVIKVILRTYLTKKARVAIITVKGAQMKSATLKPLNPRSPDTKYVGEEPLWREQPTQHRFTSLSRAFNWYNYFYGKKDAKDMIASYLERHDRVRDAKKIRTLGDGQIRLTTGWLCRMSMMGLQLDEHEQIKLDNMIAELLAIKDEVKVEVPEADIVPKITIQDRLREKVSECMGELDGQFDEFVAAGAKLSADYKPVSVMRSMNIAPQMVSMIRDTWTRKLAEFEEVVAGKDADLVKAYDYMTKTQLKNCVKFCELVISDCGSYVQIKKVERKPRKVKAVPPEKKAAKFKICVEFAELKLRSLPAAQLVDKSEAWLYDTKKRKLIHVVADEYAKVFTVKNNAVIGFSTVETLQKTVRKPAEIIRAMQAAGKPAARKIFKELTTTETPWNARGTENLIVLKAW